MTEDDENENAPTDRVCLAIEHARLTTQSDFFSRRTRGAQSPGHMSLGHQQATPESELHELRELIVNTQKQMVGLCQRVQTLEASHHTRLHSEVIPGLQDLIDKLEAQLTAQSHWIEEVHQKILLLDKFQDAAQLILEWQIRRQNTEAEGAQEDPQLRELVPQRQGEQAERSPGPDEGGQPPP